MSDGLFFRNIEGGLFKICEEVVLQMMNYAQDDQQKTEAGGILLGRFIVGTADVVVDQVTTPMPGDKRSRYWFFLEARDHQTVIDRRWNQSKHRCNYIGGWHTHAEVSPSPSGTDTRDWKRALKKNQFDSETLFFVIVGTREIRVWEGDRHSGAITELLIVSDLKGT